MRFQLDPDVFGDALIGDDLQKKVAQLRALNVGVDSADNLAISDGDALHSASFADRFGVWSLERLVKTA